MRQVVFVNLGAHITNTAPLMAPIETSCALATLYRMPLIEVRSRIVSTNTPPLGAHAEPLRPEPNYVMERLIDTAAREMKIDPFELRRRNLTRHEDESFTAALDKATEVAAIDGFATRKGESARRDKLRGLGLGNYSEVAATSEQKAALGVYRDGAHVAEVEVSPDTGSFDVVKYTMVVTLGRAIHSGENFLMRSGESIDKGALPAVMNAIVDALSGKHVDAPATADDVLRALNAQSAMLGLN
jgi:carbon-monoxide dehydrogenase large subunit